MTKTVFVPTWRQDILRLADLAEEVARFYGYDKIPTTLPKWRGYTWVGVSYKTTIREYGPNGSRAVWLFRGNDIFL